jgi:aminopeptidase N
MILSYSEPYGAPAWWMCKDDPSDKATYSIHLTVPDTLTAVSNGLLTSAVDNGDGTLTFNWESGYPMSPYLFSIAVTNFAAWTETYTALDGFTTMDVDYYAFPNDLEEAMESWNRNIEMMEYYAGIFGEYPFLDEKYGIAEFSHGGAMEHQTCTSMGAYWVNGTHTNDFVVAHELAHSWVGDMITMSEWSHAWTKEGFATYCEALYFEQQYGTGYYHYYMRDMDIYNYGEYQIYDIDPPLHGAIYYKGAWVMHMLRHVIGDAAYFDAIYAYTNTPDFRYDVADTEDLRGVFESAAGMDLEWFFDQWVYNPGYPDYDVFWTAAETGGGWDITLDVEQVQSLGPVFKMPVDIEVTTVGGVESFVVGDSLATQSFILHVDEQPTGLSFDPDQWILRRLTLTSGVSLPGPEQAMRLVPNQPNPFGSSTWIGYHLQTPSRVVLDIYDAGGRWIERLIDEPRPAGAGGARWDGRSADGRAVAPGIYYTKMRAGSRTATRPVIIIR